MIMNKQDLEKLIDERLDALPPVVHEAINTIDIESHLRQLAEYHKLHLDQWVLLEVEIMLTLLDINKASDMTKSIMACFMTPSQDCYCRIIQKF